MERRALGTSGVQVSAIGLGCWGMSGSYGPADEAESVATLHHALDLGVDFIDTADSYGDDGHNESLIGRALEGRRHEFVLATKTGWVKRAGPDGKAAVGVDGRPERIRSACEASLARLRTDVIDLYYLHRVDPDVPVEESVGAMAELVAAGKVRFLGLSEVSEATLRRAHAVHPITALQSEYSLWTREPEATVMPACRELGIAFVPFSPLGRGFLTGAVTGREAHRTGRLAGEQPPLHRGEPRPQPGPPAAPGGDRPGPRQDARPGRPGLGLVPRRAGHPHPRHEAAEPPRRERGGGGHGADARGAGPAGRRLPARCGGGRQVHAGGRPLGGPLTPDGSATRARGIPAPSPPPPMSKPIPPRSPA